MKHQIPLEVLSAWDRGDRVEAIRILRQLTGLSLREAKEVLDAVPFTGVITELPVLRASLPPAILSAIERGDKVQAIKLIRETTGFGLKEAKDIFDKLVSGVEVTTYKARQTLAPGEVPRSRKNWPTLALFCVLVIAILSLAAKMLAR